MSTKVSIQTILSKPLGHLLKNWLRIKRFLTLKKLQGWAGTWFNLLIVSTVAF